MKPGIYFIISVAVVFAGFVFLVGCEIESADYPVRIEPDSATISKHASITLTAYDGYQYQWSLSTETWGTLNTRKGNQVIYTSLYEPSGSTPEIQIVTVVSTFSSSGSGVGGTNSSSSTSVSYSAEAYITHLPSSSTN